MIQSAKPQLLFGNITCIFLTMPLLIDVISFLPFIYFLIYNLLFINHLFPW